MSHEAPFRSRILIVDDEPTGREVLLGLLAAEGYDVQVVGNGLDAIAVTLAEPPDLILLDVMMPGIDGFEVCRTIRDHPDVREVPIVLVTALDDRESRLRGLEHGADDFVTKPFDRVELRARVRSITRLNRYRTLLAERARLVEAYEATLDGWVRALDLRDRETEGHTQRVTAIAVRLARRVGLGSEACEDVRRGALLHDIGKIGVPDGILHKPGQLTPEEWMVMRQHPTYAREMLQPIDYLQPAIDIAYCHHERWDGAGYPQGLSGENIPYVARLFAVVDSFDALTSARPYKEAWSPASALDHIEQHAGSHFDPVIAGRFVAMARSGAFDDVLNGRMATAMSA